MSRLKPGVAYIYEQVNGVTFARESGSPPNTRIEIGRTCDSRTPDGRPLHDHIQEDKLWGDIRRAARTNPTLQDALDHAIMIYNLIKIHE